LNTILKLNPDCYAIGCKFTDKAFQPSKQVEERDYFTYLPLWLCYRLVAFSGSLKYGGNFSPDVLGTIM